MPTRRQTKAQAEFIAEALRIDCDANIQTLIDEHLSSSVDSWCAPSNENCLISFTVPKQLRALPRPDLARPSLWQEANGNFRIPTGLFTTPR